jgi:hypothetical protein
LEIEEKMPDIYDVEITVKEITKGNVMVGIRWVTPECARETRLQEVYVWEPLTRLSLS